MGTPTGTVVIQHPSRQRAGSWKRALVNPLPAPPAKLKLLDRVRLAIRARHHSRKTEDAYVAWIKRFIFYHGNRYPAEMGAAEITRFLSSLAGGLAGPQTLSARNDKCSIPLAPPAR